MFARKRISVILNPSSGTESAESLTELIRTTIHAGQAAELDLRLTAGSEDASNWAREAADDGFDLVIAGGGDGTVSSVAHGVLKSTRAPAIGIIPLGTGNGLARILGLPLGPAAALKAMQAGKIVELDALDVLSHDATSLLFLGAGLDAEINRDADAKQKARLGFLAYVQATLGNLRGRHNHQVSLIVDGQERQLRAHTVILFNATHLELLGIGIGPDAQPHDGVAELAVMTSPGFWPVVGQLLRIAGRSTSRPELEHVRSLKLEAEPPMPVHVDGDVIGETPVEVRIRPAALRFVADGDYDIPN
jgi:YegS/Rv2252/BmrU family lipid kinase